MTTETNNLSLTRKITDTLRAYVKTQLIIITIVTVVSWMALSLLHVRFSLLLAFITGALSVVPTLGMITAAAIAALVAVLDGASFLQGPAVFEGVAILLLFVAINFLIDLFVSPYLMGKTANIHPVILFISVIVGSAMFGFIGAFLAVPVLLVTNTVRKHYQERAPEKS